METISDRAATEPKYPTVEDLRRLTGKDFRCGKHKATKMNHFTSGQRPFYTFIDY